VSDALRAAMTVDDVVLVARPGNTDRTDLQHTRELLDRMGHTPTGLLVVGGTAASDAYVTYGSEIPIEPVETNGRALTRTSVSARRMRAGADTPSEKPAKPANPVSRS
jgi:hypothetical protein